MTIVIFMYVRRHFMIPTVDYVQYFYVRHTYMSIKGVPYRGVLCEERLNLRNLLGFALDS